MDLDDYTDQRDGDQPPAQGFEIGQQRLDRGLGLGKTVLQHPHPGCADRRRTRSASTARGAAFRQDFVAGGSSGAKGTGRGGKGSPEDRAGPRSKAVPCMCFEACAPPTARLCSALR